MSPPPPPPPMLERDIAYDGASKPHYTNKYQI